MKSKRHFWTRVALMLLALFAITVTAQASESENDYMYHRPIGHIETIEPKAASLSVTGWGLDLDGNHMTNVSIILKQNGTVKYEFVVETNEYRGSFYGNAYYRGYHGFNLNSVAVKPGTYKISGIVHNRGWGKKDMPMTFASDNVDPFAHNNDIAYGRVTTIEKTITILPYEFWATFDCNYEGGTNPASLGIGQGEYRVLPTDNISRPGYTFVCWQPGSVRGASVTAKAYWLPGTGTKQDPWRITCQEDWNNFSLLCSTSTAITHPGKTSKVPHPVPDYESHVRLETNITTGGGLDRFMGEFDGNGHTITLNGSSSLFTYTSDCYIHDLTVNGSITTKYGGIKGGLAMRMEAGAGYQKSRESIVEDCIVSVDLNISYTGAITIGGILGRQGNLHLEESKVILRNCIFNGSLPRYGNNTAGMVAQTYTYNSTYKSRVEYENCFFTPKEMVKEPKYTFSDAYLDSSSGMYYTIPGTNAQGEQIFAELPAGRVNTIITAPDGVRYYLPQSDVSFTGLNNYYVHTGSPIAISYSVNRNGSDLAANDYTAVIKNAAGETVTSVQDIGQYRLEVTIPDVGTYIRLFYVRAPLTLAGGVYQINDVADWETFNENLAEYRTASLRLNIDITTETMVGREDCKFGGTFDGNGHTLTYNYVSYNTVYDQTEDGRAPFRYIEGATIRNLTVAGTTVSTGREMGGLVAYAYGDNNITNCIVQASLTSRIGGDATNGGFIAHVKDYGTTTFSGCIFSGYLISGPSCRCNGGFVGWTNGQVNFTDCLFDPVCVTMADTEGSTFSRGFSEPSCSETYYTTAFGAAQGIQACMSPQDYVCEKKTMANGSEIYVVRGSSIVGLADAYPYNGGSAVTVSGFAVEYNGQQLPAGKYAVTFRNEADEVVDAPTAVGVYTLTVTGYEGLNYYGSLSKTFWVTKTLTTDANGFYLISDNGDWLSLDFNIKNNPAFAGSKVKLANDLSVTTMLTDEDHHFKGVFDGGGHTLTVNLQGTGMAAPFLYVDNATFLNLHVAGTIRTSNDQGFMGGVVALSLGNHDFISCRSSVDIGCSHMGCAGGLVGYAGFGENRAITMTDCLFDGMLRGEIAYASGFVGYHYTEWPSTTISMTNCLMNGATDASQGAIVIASPFYGYPGSPNPDYYTLTNSYYTSETTPNCNIYNGDQGSYTALYGTDLQAQLGDGWTVNGSGEVVPASASLYTRSITIADGITHGKVECAVSGIPDEPVTVTLTPEDGYETTAISYNDGDDHAITPVNGAYSFIMPDADITISVTFSLNPNAVSYVAYNPETKAFEPHRHISPTAITSTTTTLGAIGQETWYMVNSDVTVNNRMTTLGTVNLILCDGKTLTAAIGITVRDNNQLVIYGQEAGTGALVATGADNSAGIGLDGNDNNSAQAGGIITIHGGHITAQGAAWSAGIGGGVNCGGGTVIFYGGSTYAATAQEHSGEAEAIGHGSGWDSSASKTLADGVCVKVGSSTTPVNYAYRYNSLNTFDNKIVTVERCTEHNWVDNHCTYCGLQHHYTVTYVANADVIGDVPQEEMILIDGDLTVTVSGNTGEMERTGYTFAGWNTEADGSGTKYAAGSTFTISEMMTLYAQWTPITYLISYDLGSGTDKGNPVKYTITDGDITLINPSREGYDFKGWTGTDLDAVSMSVTIPAGSMGNRSYTATWEWRIPRPYGMEIDRDYAPDEVGYYYVNMPGDDYEIERYNDETGEYEYIETIDADYNPKTVNITEGFTYSFKVYDSGGKNGDYWNSWEENDYNDEYNSSSEYSTLTLTCPEDYVFSVQGTIDTYDEYDDLTIYDGASTSCEPLLNRAWGEKTLAPTLSTGNSITFYFEHDGMDSNDGFDITVSLVPQPTVISLVENSLTPYGATVSWTGISDSYILEIAEGAPVGGGSNLVWTTVDNDATSPYTFDNLNLATTYSVRATGVIDDVQGEPSNILSFTTQGSCPQPTNLDIVENSITAHGATMSWRGFSDNYNIKLEEVNYLVNADFETGDLSQAAFTTTDDYPWTVEANDHSGSWCAKSATGNDDETSALELEVTVTTDKALTFSAKVSSESGSDFAYFSIDGNDEIDGISGDGDWNNYEYPLTAGTHTLRWYYTKDSGVNAYDDCFYVDDIKIIDGSTEVGNYTSNTNSYTLTGLQGETTYTVQVQGVGDNETSPWSEPCAFTTAIACLRPTGLTAGTPEARSVELSWTENGEATQWQICMDDDESNLTLVDANPYTLSGLVPGTDYRVKVRAYKDAIDQSSWSNVVTFKTEIVCPTPTNVTASDIAANSATISWNSKAGNYNVKYREATYVMNEVFFDNFENGLRNWTTYERGYSGSGTNWQKKEGNAFTNHSSTAHSGTYVAMSRSYDGSAHSVDNWLVSPQMTLGDCLKFWVLDDGNYHEDFKVYVSTATNDVSDFELVADPGDASDTWSEITVDLSAYAGQQGYIAIRHTDYDQNYLFIDDFGVYVTYTFDAENTVTATTNPYELDGLYAGTTYEVQVQANSPTDGKSDWSSPIMFTTDFDLILANDADNSEAIRKAAANGSAFNVTLAGRTLWKDGEWNTLCLPFDLTIAGSVLDGDDVDVRALSSASLSNDGVLTLNFTDEGAVTELTAGTPYIIMWAGDGSNNLENPEFSDMKIKASTSDFNSTDGAVHFKGTYTSTTFTETNKSILLLGAENTLYFPQPATDPNTGNTVNPTIGACRAFFELTDPSAQVKAFVLNFGDDTETGLTPNPSPVREGSASAWYDLSGRKLINTPSLGEGRGGLPRGIYIHNGKKVVIK